MYRSKYFNIYFNEAEDEQQQIEGDPNQQMEVDPNAMMQQEPPPPAMLDDDTDPNAKQNKTDIKFPEEKDGTTPEQDLLNFTNYQKLQYFKKFNSLLKLIQQTKLSFNNSKNYVNFDEIDNEKQHKIINLLISSLEEITDQINFFLEKGIASVNIDKTRAIFNAIIKKLNLIIDSFEGIMRQVKLNDENKK